MGRKTKETYYRKYFEGKKLNEALNKARGSYELATLYDDFIENAKKERKARLLNNIDIIKQLDKFISLIEDRVSVDTDILDIISYKDLYYKIKNKQWELEKKANGGNKTAATKRDKANAVKYSEWIEIPLHGFSINFMYSVGKKGRMVRSEAYATWRNKFPHELIPEAEELLEYGIDVYAPIGIEAQFICKDKFDVDNFSKSLIDAIYENYGDDDNNVCETKCTRIGTCEEYKDGMIRYRMYNIKEGIQLARETDWSKVPKGTKVRAYDNDEGPKYEGIFLCYDKVDKESPFLIYLEFASRAYWFNHCELIKEVIQLARKKKETELSPEEERRLEITKKLNKEQKLFCYHFIVEDKSMKDAYKAAYP